MGCQLGRVIIQRNEGTIIFGNVRTININTTSVSTEGTNSSSSETASANNGESSQNAATGMDFGMESGMESSMESSMESRKVLPKRYRRNRYKRR
jgi:hypothetical protein